MEIDSDDPSVIDFSPQFTATSPTMNPAVPIEFEASGVGGVLPADNFAINCQMRHYLLPDNHGHLPVSRSRALKSKLHKRILHRIPKASIDAFYDNGNTTDSSAGSSSSSETSGAPSCRSKRPLRHELLSANTLRLPPSSLPPASYIFTSTSEDSSSNGETDSDDAPRSSGSEGYFFQQSLDAYRTSSTEENEPATTGLERSPSSAATAGDGSRESSIFSDHNDDEQTYDGPLSMDSEQSSDSADVNVRLHPDDADVDRPNLKRSRGSVISSASNHQARKAVRMTNVGLQSNTESDES